MALWRGGLRPMANGYRRGRPADALRASRAGVGAKPGSLVAGTVGRPAWAASGEAAAGRAARNGAAAEAAPGGRARTPARKANRGKTAARRNREACRAGGTGSGATL